MKGTKSMWLIVVALTILSMAAFVPAPQNTPVSGHNISLPKTVFSTCEAVPITVVTGTAESGAPQAVPLCITAPGGALSSVNATGEYGLCKAIFWPGRGVAGTYRVSLPGNDDLCALFSVDAVAIANDIAIAGLNDSLLCVNGSVSNASGGASGPYAVACSLDGAGIFSDGHCVGDFYLCFNVTGNATHYLSTRATDPQGIAQERIDIIDGGGVIATLSDRMVPFDTGEGAVWAIFSIVSGGPVSMPLEALHIPVRDQVSRAWLSSGPDIWDLPVGNGTVNISSPCRPGDRLCLEIVPADGSGAYLESAYGVVPDADGAWPPDVPRLADVPPASGAETQPQEAGNGTEPDFVQVDAFGPLNVTNQPWPQDSQWITWVNYSWGAVCAPTYDVSPREVDISSGGTGSSPVGPNSSIYLCYNNSSKFLFFRMLLSKSPISSSVYSQYMWGVEIDNNNDGLAEWGTFIEGDYHPTDSITVGYKQLGHTDNRIDYFIYAQDANPALGFTRVVTDGRGQDSNQMYFLDWQVPLAAFSVSSTLAPANVTENSTIRLFFGTSTNQRMFDKDILGQAAINFSIGPNMTVGGLGNGGFGTLYDTRDPAPPSNLGIWYYNQTVTVNGSGWPAGNPALTSLTVRVINSTGTVFNTTAVSYNTTKGVVTNAPIWNIPANGTPAPGLYGIWVKNPGGSETYKWYDNFTLWDNIPPVVRNVTVTPGLVAPNATIRITASVTDNYQIANVTAAYDTTRVNMTYNATSRLYEANATAPAAGGSYVIMVVAYDVYANAGINTTLLTVIAGYPSVEKMIVWSSPSLTFNISLNVTNRGNPVNVIVFDFVPAGFSARVGGNVYPGPLSINFTRYLFTGQSVYINYTMSSNASAYNAAELGRIGLDPVAVTG